MGTVLVIDDSATDMGVISGCLQQEGITVLKAKSSEEAMDLLGKGRPDAIILDVVLPGRSGFELCRDLKDEVATSGIPVILCSTKKSEMDKFWGMKQGADAYLSKPVDQAELRNTLKQVMAG